MELKKALVISIDGLCEPITTSLIHAGVLPYIHQNLGIIHTGSAPSEEEIANYVYEHPSEYDAILIHEIYDNVGTILREKGNINGKLVRVTSVSSESNPPPYAPDFQVSSRQICDFEKTPTLLNQMGL